MSKSIEFNEITDGNLLHAMIRFSVPYLTACFLQTFYGLADLFITGQFNAADTVTAVSVGSQVMHMLTVIIVGLAMGTTVSISHAIGAQNHKQVSSYIGNSISIFTVFAAAATILLLLSVQWILAALQAPAECLASASQYLIICFIGIPLITAYNVISSIFRGLGDTKRPMIFVAIAGVINIGLDCLFIGAFGMGAAGAALATVIAQAISVILVLLFIRKIQFEIKLEKEDLKFQKQTVNKLLGIGAPIACQDGLIQISFLIITAIANIRGVIIAVAVGIVEKIISFLFLVPSAMLSTVSAVAAQNAGAGKHDRGCSTLRYGITVCVIFGIVVWIVCQFASSSIVGLFVRNETEVVLLGSEYLRAYSLDCIFGGIHFCFSGYFSAYGKSMYSFAHNLISTVAVRVPGAYLAAVLYPSTLYPMGLAAPAGSLLSSLICIFLYKKYMSKQIPMSDAVS